MKKLKKLTDEYERSKKKRWFRYKTELNVVSKDFTQKGELFLEDDWNDAFESESDLGDEDVFPD